VNILASITEVVPSERGFSAKALTGGGKEFVLSNYGYRKSLDADSRVTRVRQPKIDEQIFIIPGEQNHARHWTFAKTR